MITVTKNNGAKSSTGEAKKGNKGRVDLFAQQNPDGTFSVRCVDVGNYGRVRSWTEVPVTREDLEDMAEKLHALAVGLLVTTEAPREEPQAEPTPEATSENVADAVELSA